MGSVLRPGLSAGLRPGLHSGLRQWSPVEPVPWLVFRWHPGPKGCPDPTRARCWAKAAEFQRRDPLRRVRRPGRFPWRSLVSAPRARRPGWAPGPAGMRCRPPGGARKVRGPPSCFPSMPSVLTGQPPKGWKWGREWSALKEESGWKRPPREPALQASTIAAGAASFLTITPRMLVAPKYGRGSTCPGTIVPWGGAGQCMGYF